MKHEKQIKRALRRLKTPDMRSVLPNAAAEAHTVLRPRKRWLTVPMAAAMAILLTLGVAALPVIIGRINQGYITETAQQLTEPPEG